MSRNGQDGPWKSNGKPVAEYVVYVFKCCKAERNENGIYDSVKTIVEVEIIPCLTIKEEKVCALFHNSNHKKSQKNNIFWIVRINQPVEN